jgi:hypothetical protein
MRERLFILLSLIVIIVALVGLNAASYVRIETEPDTEERPRRTTFNAGATGTRAFYDFLRERGNRAVRWQQKTSALLEKNRNQPTVFVVIGSTLREFDEEEIRAVHAWTERGGRLVVIDREPEPQLLPPAGAWLVTAQALPFFLTGNVNPDNVGEMTNGVTAFKPVLPSILTDQVGSVMPSKFAASIKLEYITVTEKRAQTIAPMLPLDSHLRQQSEELPAPPPPMPVAQQRSADGKIKNDTENVIHGDEQKLPPAVAAESNISTAFAPAAHFADKDKIVLVDYPYGAGRVVFLSDPYIVSNGGIGLVDNLRLALNLVGGESGDGVIAFDEYHHGYGASGNELLNYFQNTPLPAIAAQLALLVALLVYTKGKRFARPVPLPDNDRRSKLEYVAAMAELQRRAKTYDLAIENIYNRVRRELAKFAGVDNQTTSNRELAARIAERSKIDEKELENLLRACEDIVQGAPVNDKKALALVGKLRAVEEELGFFKRRPQRKI